ncbi:MAG: Flp pilus assembly protein CpaB [Actinomycetota bacterium]|nr:Flp pilus assembly protein CpaB [Actinomycetota bacterium]
MTYRVRNVGIAVALAAVAALLTSFYVTNYKRHVQRNENSVTVLVAKNDIPVGTPGSDVANMLSTTEVPRRNVVPGAISNASEIESRVAAQPTYAGEQVTSRRFSTVAEAGVDGQLKGAMRAYQLSGDQNQLLAGTVKDGDHVDLVAALDVKSGTSGDSTKMSRVALRDIKVLKAPQDPAIGSKLTGGLDQKFTALLAVTDNQAQKIQLILATTNSGSTGGGSDWHFQLRPVVHPADSPDHVDSVRTVLLDGIRRGRR